MTIPHSSCPKEKETKILNIPKIPNREEQNKTKIVHKNETKQEYYIQMKLPNTKRQNKIKNKNI